MSSSDTPRPRVAAALTAALSVGAMAVALSVVDLPPPSGAETQPASEMTTPPPYTSKWIAVDTATPSITLNDATGRIGSAQTLAEAPDCAMDQGAAATRFLSFSGSTSAGARNPGYDAGLASFAGGDIGVKEKKSGQSCSQVDGPGEGLRLSLGSALASTLGYAAVASSAYLDVELKQDAQILATLTKPDGTSAYFALYSGSTVSSPVPMGLTDAQLPASHKTTCNMPADSGPDSGVNDHCRWPISVPSWAGSDDGIMFTSITLRAVNGSFSLDGGSEGAVLPPAPLSTPNASIIEVVDGTITCGAASRTITGAGDAPQMVVTRLDNADGSTCAAVPYSMDASPGAARFLKPLDTQTTAQFVWDLTWALPLREAALQPTTALQDLTIDYETGETPVGLAWCPVSGYAASGAFVGYTKASDGTWPAGVVDQSAYSGIQFACVISRDAQPLAGSSPTKIRSYDKVYVLGDARISLN